MIRCQSLDATYVDESKKSSVAGAAATNDWGGGDDWGVGECCGIFLL